MAYRTNSKGKAICIQQPKRIASNLLTKIFNSLYIDCQPSRHSFRSTWTATVRVSRRI